MYFSGLKKSGFMLYLVQIFAIFFEFVEQKIFLSLIFNFLAECIE